MRRTFLFFVGSLLRAGTAEAWATFSVGPRLGLHAATAHFAYMPSSLRARLTGSIQVGRFAVPPRVLFSQKGYASHGSRPSFESPVTFDETVRLNYLLPLNLAYTLGQAGQGLQVFAGSYVGLLLGRNYTQQVQEGAATWGRPPRENTVAAWFMMPITAARSA
jgi:hypothetical protein